VRGLKSTCSQLLLPVDPDGLAGVWEMMSADARERVLRLLAGVIGSVVSDQEGER
jgi:hypothetical protein